MAFTLTGDAATNRTNLGLGTAATLNTGSGSGDVPLNSNLGTAAALDVGTGANNILQLDGSGNLPAVDGSALTGVDALPTGGTAGQFITTDGTTASWADAPSPGMKLLYSTTVTNTGAISLNGDSVWGSNNDYYAHKVILSFVGGGQLNLYQRVIDSNTNQNYSGNDYSHCQNMINSASGGPHAGHAESVGEFKIDRDWFRGGQRFAVEMDIWNMRIQSNDAPLQYAGSYANTNHDGDNRLNGTTVQGCLRCGLAVNSRKSGLYIFTGTNNFSTATVWVYGYANP